MKVILILFLTLQILTALSQTTQYRLQRTSSRIASAMLQSNVRVEGKVFLSNQRGSAQVMSTKQYLSDLKVILIRLNSVSDEGFIKENRRQICNNDRSIFQRYSPQVAYTDRNGSYSFTNLISNGYYVLIYCDRNIQATSIQLGSNSYKTYVLPERSITL